MSDKANYGGGKSGNLHEGLKKRSPPVEDKSRGPIGGKYGSVDADPNRSKPSESSPTVGPRTA